MENRSFIAIDGLNLLRKVFEANPEDDSAEKAANVCRAALSTFKRAVQKTEGFNPTHGAAVFDAGGDTWRHELYPDYKAGRKPMSQHLRDAIPGFEQTLWEELGIRSIRKEGVEAEDVIATLAYHWTKEGTILPGRFVVFSSDKDLFVLGKWKAEFRDVFKRDWITHAHIEEKFGVPCHLISEYLALTGDKEDGVPGVPKVGPKTAATYLLQYGSLDGVIEAAERDELTGKVGESMKDHTSLARFCLKLTSLKSDLTLGLNWSSLKLVK